jgi:hypothetical protein
VATQHGDESEQLERERSSEGEANERTFMTRANVCEASLEQVSADCGDLRGRFGVLMGAGDFGSRESLFVCREALSCSFWMGGVEVARGRDHDKQGRV